MLHKFFFFDVFFIRKTLETYMVPRVFLSGKEHVGVCTEGMATASTAAKRRRKEHVGVCTEGMASSSSCIFFNMKEHVGVCTEGMA